MTTLGHRCTVAAGRMLQASEGGTSTCGFSPRDVLTRPPTPSRRASGEPDPLSLCTHVSKEHGVDGSRNPLLPGKTDDWRKWVEVLNGPRRQEFIDSRRCAGVPH